MKRITRLPSRCALALAIGLAFAAPVAYSAGLGRITVQSALGQPLRAEVEVTAVSREEAASLAVRLASAAAFQQANLEYNPALIGLRVTLDRRNETTYVVRIASQSAVSEPYLDLLLELTSSAGRVLREYTVLLDPPALRANQEVVAPAPSRAPAAAAPAAAPAASAAAPRTAPSASAAPSSIAVRRGDTLGSIAEKTRPASASREQMLVSLFRANPGAFIAGNMNNLRADTVLTVPPEQQVLSTDPATARREVAAQSADFARYRSRLAQAATAAGPSGAAAAGQGRITSRVEERAPPPPSGDQLKIAQPAPGARSGDEAIARDRQIQDLLDRVAELERTNQQLQKALELQSRTGAQVQAAAEGKPAQPAPPPAAVPPPAAAPAAAAPPPAAAPAPTPPAVAAPAPAPAADAQKAAAPKGPAPVEEPSLLSSLLSSNTPVIAGLGAVLVALLGYWAYRRRTAGSRQDYDLGAEAAQGNSLFGQTGGRSIDTGAASTFNSSFIPPATQLDSTEVDPVAEADVYIAYGREEQAEDILKEALRVQPDRHAARVKMMELLANRGDKAGFARHAADLRARTGGAGEDWERAATIGRAFDPTNSMFGTAASAAAEMISREAMTELHLGPETREALGVTTGGFSQPLPPTGVRPQESLRASPPVAPKAAPIAARMPDSALPADTRLQASTVLPLEAKSTGGGLTVTGNSRPQREGAPTELSELEFEAIAPATQIVDPEAAAPPAPGEAPLDYDLRITPAAAGVAPKLQPLPDIDLNLTPAPTSAAPATRAGRPEEITGALDFGLPVERAATIKEGPATIRPAQVPDRRPQPSPIDDMAARPTLLGGMTALPEGITRMAPNTDQATVPLIDFDLTGADLPLNTNAGRAGAMTGSPMAAQIATKLDLARGYIDLGVKDGARELLEEVMREGTREQRQSAIELMKQIDR